MDKEKCISIIDATPLVSIDLIITNAAGNVLLGKRLNNPEQGFGFVPGGRIKKNEKIAEAIKRVSLVELGVDFSLDDMTLLGGYEHIYEDNCFSEPGINTHYVVLAYMTEVADNVDIKPDDQHSEMRWWTIGELLQSGDVHQNKKNYFISTE